MSERAGRPAHRNVVAVFSGGGTGGHLYPALSLSGALGKLRPDLHAVFVGAERGLEARVLPSRGVEHVLLPVEGFRRGAGQLRANLRVPARLLAALARVGALFHRLRPSLVVVTGGYAGGPAGLMAGVMGLRLVLQEQNSVPGVTTRVLSLWAREVHVAFPEAVPRLPGPARRKARTSGNPVAPPRPLPRASAAARFGIPPHGVVALVVGGSQGARALNEAVLEAVSAVAESGEGRPGARPRPEGLHLLWATGPAHEAAVRARLAALGEPDWVHPVGYIDDMPSALAVADLAVSRAGAMGTSEFLAWGVPSVLVPLPSAAADHQTRNAEALAASGAAVHLPEAELDGARLWAELTALAGDPHRRREMASRARARGKPDAADEIARSLARQLPPPERAP